MTEEQLPVEISVGSVVQHLKDESAVLIDCREQDEYDVAAIEGSILLPMSQWAEVSGRLTELTDKHLIVHCHHGMRSLQVARWLRENGFPNAQSMTGGIAAWSTEIDPTIPQY